MDINLLTNVLLDLRKASITSTPDTIESVMQKYDMLFLGSKFNTIYSIELRHCLDKTFNYNVSIDELHSVIPQVCKTLDMKLEKLIAATDVTKPNPKTASFQITLWE